MVTAIEGPTREPCLLSEWGEGYCRWCQFVVGLTHWGKLATHYRGRGLRYEDKLCPGSLKAPAKRTPYSSRTAAFRVTPRQVWCEACEKPAPTTHAGGYWVYSRHWMPKLSPLAVPLVCENAYRAVPAN